MDNKNINEIVDILRKKSNSRDYIYEFVINYYLSRKLKTNSFEDIKEKFGNEIIKQKLKFVYEDDENLVEQFNSFKDFTSDEIIEIIGELSDRIGRVMDWGKTTVKSIIDLSKELLNLSEGDKFLDVGSGLGITSLEVSRISKVSGIEINRESYVISCLLLDLFDIPVENLVYSDALTYDLSKFNANKVFMNMPIGLRVSEGKFHEVLRVKFDSSIYKNHIKSTEISWFFALDIIENTKYEKFVMVMNGNPLYGDIHKDIRKILINRGNIEAVIALPSNLLAYTSIPIYLVVFSHDNKNIKFVDGTKLYSSMKQRNTLEEGHIKEIISSLDKKTNISNIVGIKKLEEEDFTLDPIRYTMPEFPFDESLELKDVVKSINRGHTISKKDLDNMTSVQPTNCQYLMLQNFQDGILDGNLPYLKNIDETYERYLLKNNSIIVSRLAPFKIGSVGKLKTKVLANGNLFYLEVDEDKINKDFLTAYLQSRIGLKEIGKYVKGSTMKTISIKDLGKVKIPKVSMEKQIEIGEAFVLLNSEFKAIKKRAEDIAKERLDIFEGEI